MLDHKLLRTDLDNVAAQLARRGFTLDTSRIDELEEQRKALQVRVQELQARRNRRSKEIGKAKAAGVDIAPLLEQVEGLGNQLKETDRELEEIQAALNAILEGVPNIPHESVPSGTSEEENEEIRRWGEAKRFAFEALDHVDRG